MFTTRIRCTKYFLGPRPHSRIASAGPVAILLLIFVPVHPEYFGLCDRLRDARYRPTAADREVARASSWQTHYHMVGGALGFVVSPIVEAAAL